MIEVAREDQLAQAFLATRKTESALREVVRGTFSLAYGPLWLSHLPEEVTSRWTEKQQQAEAEALSRGPELIEYADLSELTDLIRKYWEIFEPRFRNHDLTHGNLNEFRLLRNALMHGARLTSEECERLIYLANGLHTQCIAEIKPISAAAIRPPSEPTKPHIPPRLDPGQVALLQVVTRATEHMSGLLTGELQALDDYLRKNLSRCTIEALAVVRDKFATLPGTNEWIETIYRQLPPPRPKMPTGKKEVGQWLKWADLEYIPYRRWLIKAKRADAEVEEMALTYEDWLSQNYPQLLLKGSSKLVMNIYQVVRQQLDERVRVLWLVVDNLCGLWRSEFVSALMDAGIRIRDAQRMLAMLPTTSSISRRAMLAGRPPVEAVRFADDESACRQLATDIGVSKMAFCKSISEVEQVIRQNVDLIVLIYDWLDTLAHMPDEPGFDREDEMTSAMGKLAVKVSEVMRKMSQVGPVRLVVSTDHGSIWPSPESEVIEVPPFAAFEEGYESHRCVSTIGDTAALSHVDWHILDAQSYRLPATYIVPRGQRYIGMRPRAFTHGGLSPEETVVSLLVGEVGDREQIDLVLTQATPALRLGRRGPLAILVRNPFDILVEDLEISFLDLYVRFDPVDVPPRSEVMTAEQEVMLPTRFEVQDGVGYLNYVAQYKVAGKAALTQGSLRVNVRIVYQSSMDELEDMLNV